MKKLKKTNIFFILLLLFLSCKSKYKYNFLLYEKQHQELCNKNNKKDTIYFVFKHKINEVFKKVKFDPPKWYSNVYYFNFPELEKNTSMTVHYRLVNQPIIDKTGEVSKQLNIEKDKKFLKKIKDKTYTYNDFKNLSKREIGVFFSYNNFKTTFLIDIKDTKNKNIYLREVHFSSSFPREQ